MSTTIIDDLWVCDDCIMIVANDTLGDEDHDADVLHKGKMTKANPDLMFRWARMVPTNVEHVIEFSVRQCDGCGNYLAGRRHGAAILIDTELRKQDGDEI